MTPPIWLDAAGRGRPIRACWNCGREVAVMRMRSEHLRRTGGSLAGRSTFRLVWLHDRVRASAGTRWLVELVPIWEPDQVANPLRRYGPTEPR
jgi:hypothetical protein